jgi:hypothetical protein
MKNWVRCGACHCQWQAWGTLTSWETWQAVWQVVPHGGLACNKGLTHWLYNTATVLSYLHLYHIHHNLPKSLLNAAVSAEAPQQQVFLLISQGVVSHHLY